MALKFQMNKCQIICQQETGWHFLNTCVNCNVLFLCKTKTALNAYIFSFCYQFL